MLAKTFFNEIESHAAEYRQRLESVAVIRRCLQGDVDRETYIAFLGEAYHHVKHTVPLLMACGSRLPQRLEWLREAVVEYVNEEIGHQEWILNDLQALGVDRDSVEYGQPKIATEVMVAYAYDQVHRHNPVGLFGMVYTLEKTSSTVASFAAEQIRSSLSLPANTMSYLVSHGSLDVEHMQGFEVLMNRLDDAGDKAAVLHSIPVFYTLYRQVFKDLPQSSGEHHEN